MLRLVSSPAVLILLAASPQRSFSLSPRYRVVISAAFVARLTALRLVPAKMSD